MDQTQAAVPDNRLALQLEKIVFDRLDTNKLVLPAIPHVAIRCIELLRKPEFSLQKAAEIIETDPIIAMRIIRVSNSAAMATRDTAKNIQSAVTRLGAQKLRSLLIECVARPVFESKDRRIVDATRGLWEHSVAVALLAREIAVVLGGSDPEEAYLVGLLHDVGKPILATFLLEAEGMLAARPGKQWIDSSLWISVVQRSHRKVAVAIVKNWGLPDTICRAVAECADYDSENRQAIANIVRFSNALAKQHGLYVGVVDIDDVNALVMIGRSLLGVDDEALVRLTSGLKERARQGA
jgi:putative nucleotidyltransferase with HDIG domain